MSGRRNKSSKAKAQTGHARRRLWERFSLHLSHQEVERLAVRIRDQDRVALIERQSNRLTLWAIVVKGVKMHLVYDSRRHTVVTALHVRKARTSGIPLNDRIYAPLRCPDAPEWADLMPDASSGAQDPSAS